MVLFANAPKYSLRQSSFLAVAQSLLKLLTSLEDTRVILIGSSDRDLSPVSVCPDLSKLQIESDWNQEPVSVSPLLKAINSQPSVLRETLKEIGRHAAYLLHPSLQAWVPCNLNLQDLFVKVLPSDRTDAAFSFTILGLGDRFNVLLQAKTIHQASQKTSGDRIQVEWEFNPVVAANACTKLQHYLQDTPEILATFKQALVNWSAKPNLPEIQGELTLHLLAALDAEGEPQLSTKAKTLTTEEEERAQYAALLNRLVDQIRASLELRQIFETVVMELGHLLLADRCSILQYSDERKQWIPVTEYRPHPDILSSIDLVIPDRNNPVMSQLHNLHVVEVSDTRNLEDPLNQSLAAKYPGGWLMVPIHRQGKIWGCLSFAQDKYPRYWHRSELKFLISVADQLAIAIYQATLYQQIQQQNQTLEALVRERTAELESFFDAHPDYIFVVDRGNVSEASEKQQAMRLRFCNNAFAQVMGFENRQQVQGQSILESFSHEIGSSFAKQHSLVFESGQTLHHQESLVLADGIHHFDSFRVPLKQPNGEVYACLGTSRDITELVETKQILSERTEQLQEALSASHAASQAKTNFLATMSHELRTPLTAVIGMSSTLLKQCFGSLNPKQAEYLQIIYDSGKHLLQLINDILDLSKIEAGKESLEITQFSLREVADSSLAVLREKALVQKVKLIGELQDLPPADNFYGDERRVRQILLNLLSNAVKFTPSGGQVSLCVQYDGDIATIEVADTGIGIPANKQHLLFKAFQQIDSSLSRQHEGTGLGLALTRQLVEMHGGTIGFSSTIGVGTVFTAYLQTQRLAGDPGEQGVRG